MTFEAKASVVKIEAKVDIIPQNEEMWKLKKNIKYSAKRRKIGKAWFKMKCRFNSF